MTYMVILWMPLQVAAWKEVCLRTILWMRIPSDTC